MQNQSPKAVTRVAKRVCFSEESPEVKNESEASSSEGPEGFIRDQEYWFVDGNLILVAQNTAFRLYMGLLLTQSSVLRQKFSSAHLSLDEGTVTRTVHLPEPPHEWRYLLRRLLPKGTGTHQTTFSLREDFPMISALLRLSQKYNITEVTAYAIDALKAIYCNSYDAWRIHDRAVCGEGFDLGETPGILARAIVAINFARLYNIPSVLPTAFYHCACLGGAIMKGYTHQDGTPEYLASDDVARCINGIQVLTAVSADHVQLLRSHLPAYRTCKYNGACRRLWKQQVRDKLTRDWHSVLGNHAFRGLCETFPALSALCDVCKEKAEDIFEDRRKKVWHDLPRMFDIATYVGKWPVNVK